MIYEISHKMAMRANDRHNQKYKDDPKFVEAKPSDARTFATIMLCLLAALFLLMIITASTGG